MPRSCTKRWWSRRFTDMTSQLSAVHFAATSLAMLNPDIQFDRMNLYVMPLGAEGSNVNFTGVSGLPGTR